MKFLLDQNLSPRLVPFLNRDYPGTKHVRDGRLQSADDAIVWEFARTNSFVIASKDGDFHQRSFLYGHPPKVVWIRLGNCSTARILAEFRQQRDALAKFEADEQAAFLIIP